MGFGSRLGMAAWALVSAVSCASAADKGGLASDAGPAIRMDSAQELDTSTQDKEMQACIVATRPEPCDDMSAVCIVDLRAERSRFPACRTNYAQLPFVVSCGAYDGIVYAGIDSETTYYFDHFDGHLVGLTNIGQTTLVPCEAFDPSFSPATCDTPGECPSPDANADL
jgi:hypothetical protein